MTRTREVQCRTHGGTFTVPAKPGRPPTRCTGDNPCSKARTTRASQAVNVQTHPTAASGTTAKREPVRSNRRGKKPKSAPVQEPACSNCGNPIERRENCYGPGQHGRWYHRISADDFQLSCPGQRGKTATYREEDAEVPSRKSAPKRTPATNIAEVNFRDEANRAGKLLKRQGWNVAGSTQRIEGSMYPVLEATRGEETLSLRWYPTGCKQEYRIWPVDESASKNLPFDPDLAPDHAVVSALRGCKVTWRNALSGNVESAIIKPNADITVSTRYHGPDVPSPASRQITVITDGPAGATRTFRLSALVEIKSPEAPDAPVRKTPAPVVEDDYAF